MDYFYTTIENQKRADGSFGLLYDHFHGEDAEGMAFAKFYTICAAASIANIYTHAVIMRSDGVILDSKLFDRLPKEAIGV